MARRLRYLVFTSSVAAFSSLGSPASAQLDYHVLAGASVGGSDNPRGLSDQSEAQADGFVSATGQFDIGYVGQRSINRLGYGLMATSWLRDMQNPFITQTLRLSSDMEAGSDTRLALAAGATLARWSLADAALSADTQTGGPRPSGDQYFLGIDVGETVTSLLSGSWRLAENLEGRWYRPLGDTLVAFDNKSLMLTADLNYTMTTDWLGLRSRAAVIVSSATNTPGGGSVTSDSTGEFGELTFAWQRDWSLQYRHVLAAGALALHANDTTQWLPAASASLLWHDLGNEIEIRAARTADANVYIGAAYERNVVGLRVGIPIDRAELLRFTAAGDLEQDRTVASPAGAGTTANVAFVRSGLNWQPGNMFTFGIEYSFRYQRASDSSSGPNTPSGNATFATFRRQTVILTVGMQYPPR